jgi:hypothetical protein
MEEPHFVGKGLQICINRMNVGIDRVVICKVDAAVSTHAVSSDLSSDLLGVIQMLHHGRDVHPTWVTFTMTGTLRGLDCGLV